MEASKKEVTLTDILDNRDRKWTRKEIISTGAIRDEIKNGIHVYLVENQKLSFKKEPNSSMYELVNAYTYC